MVAPDFTPLPQYPNYTPEELQQRAAAFYAQVRTRRTIRHFSDRPVPLPAIQDSLRAAATSPSGANLQPWHFVIVGDPQVKRQIRLAAEEEERAFYQARAPQEWLEALAPLGTEWQKPFLETAPFLIAVFSQTYGISESGKKIKHYYVQESVGIATGILLTALHHIGLATLTHTPSPMNFLNDILQRPSSERPFLLLVVGYPAEDAVVPVLEKKKFSDITTFI